MVPNVGPFVVTDGPVMPVLPDDGKIRHPEPPPPAGLWLAASSARSARTFGGTRI